MQKVFPIQTSFTSGEISPESIGRSDLDMYRSAVATMRNFIPTSQGGVRRRPGFRNQGAAGSRLFVLQQSQVRQFILAVDATTLRISGSVDGAIGNGLQNGFFAQNLNDWTEVNVAGNVIWSSRRARYFGRAGLEQQITVAAGSVSFSLEAPGAEPGEHVMSLWAGTASGLKDIADIPLVAGARQEYDVTLGVGNYIRFTTEDTTFDGYVYLSQVAAGFTGNPTLIFSHPWDADTLERLTFTQNPDQEQGFFLHPDTPPYILDFDNEDFTLQAAVFNTPPTDWGQGNDWPSIMTFFQGRAYYSGVRNAPRFFWGSRVGDPLDMRTETGAGPAPVADDGVAFQLAERGRIQWLIGSRNLLIGTQNSEWVVSGPDGFRDPITATAAIYAEKQSDFGSAQIQPALIGNQVIFVAADRTRVRAMGYEFLEDNWTSLDLSFFAQHLTRRKIARLVYASNPDQTIWMVDDSGGLLGCTYERALQIVGWHQHRNVYENNDVGNPYKITQAEKDAGQEGAILAGTYERTRKFTDVAISTEFGVDRLYALIDGTVEYLADDNVPLDNMFRFQFKDPVTEIPGGAASPLPELYDVLIDGVWSGKNKIKADGRWDDLAWPGRVIEIGFAHESLLRTLTPDVMAGSGQSAFARMKRYPKVYMRIVDSQMPVLNDSRDNERRFTDVNDAQIEPYTGDKRMHTSGHSRDGSLTIIQDRGMPFNLLALFYDLAQDSL